MIEPDGIAYFYTPLSPPLSLCSHSVLYYVERFCGLCFLTDVFQSEVPRKIHEYKVLAVNGNPETKGTFLKHLSGQMGLHEPPPDISLERFRRARKQYSPEPSRTQFPVTFALWQMFGSQPKMAKPLLRRLLGSNENEIASQLDMSIYTVQVTLAKAIRTTLRYVR